MTARRNVMETWFQRVWAEEDATAVSDLYEADGPIRGLGKQDMLEAGDFVSFQKALLGLVSDVRVDIDKSIERGNWLALLCSLTAKSRSTGATVSMTGTAFVKVVDGTVREAYNHWDFIALYEQLGLLPADTFGRALAGLPLGGPPAAPKSP